MKNTTVYTHDLLLKFNLAYVARWKKNTRIYTILTAIAGIILVAADILVEQYHTAYVGAFAFLLCMTGFLSLLKSSKAKLSEKVAKELRDCPNKRIEYSFEEDFLIVNLTSAYIQSGTRICYSYITQVTKIDDHSFYFLTKNNFSYVVCDENGVSELFSYLRDKRSRYA